MIKRSISLLLLIALLVSGCSVADPIDELYVDDNFHVGGIQMSPAALAEMYMVTPAGTAILVAGTYYKVEGTEAYDELRYFTGAGDRVTYTGTRIRYFHVTVSISARSDTVNTVTTWGIAVNGTPHPSGLISHKIAVANDVGAISIHNILGLYPGDYIDVYVTADKVATITADYLVLTATSLN